MGIIEGQGVRQGMPLSPLFANVALKEFDAYIERSGIQMVRYADDFILFGTSRQECEDFHWLSYKLLKSIGHTIPEISNHGKTRIVEPKDPVEFLGVGITKVGRRTYKPFVMREQMRKIKSRILTLASLTEAQSRGLTLPRLLQRLDDVVAGYDDAYCHCDNAADVSDLCQAWKHEVLNRVFSELGVDIARLESHKRQFLGLE